MAKKIKKIEKLEEKIDPVKEFESFVAIVESKLDVAIIQATRVDTFSDMRQEMREFFGETPSVERVKHYCEVMRQSYEEAFSIFDELTFEEISADEMDDKFMPLIGDAMACTTDEEVFEIRVKWFAMRPYAEMMLALHSKVLDDIAASKANE